MKSIYQIYIELQDIEPKIWRRFQVNSDIELTDLHKIIQVLMGWTNSHLHQYIMNDKYYSPRTDGDEDFWDDTMNVDYQGLKLNDLLKKEQELMEYEYDYGDSWMHNLILEEVLSCVNDSFQPVCLDGMRHCPPEDCGGSYGYMEVLKILKNHKSPEHKEWKAWLGEGFNPEEFDIEEINKSLKQPDYGLPKWDMFE